MKHFSIVSKIILTICLCMIVLAVLNSFTGFINSTISLGGTAVCVTGFAVASAAVVILEHERAKKKEKSA